MRKTNPLKKADSYFFSDFLPIMGLFMSLGTVTATLLIMIIGEAFSIYGNMPSIYVWMIFIGVYAFINIVFSQIIKYEKSRLKMGFTIGVIMATVVVLVRLARELF